MWELGFGGDGEVFWPLAAILYDEYDSHNGKDWAPSCILLRTERLAYLHSYARKVCIDLPTCVWHTFNIVLVYN